MLVRKTILFVIMCLSGFMLQAQDSSSVAFSAESPAFENLALEIKNQIEFYPNPTTDYLIVEIRNSDLGNVEFEMHSIIGNKVHIYPEEIGRDKFKIDVEPFATGYYFIVVKDDNNRFKEAHKFLKK